MIELFTPHQRALLETYGSKHEADDFDDTLFTGDELVVTDLRGKWWPEMRKGARIVVVKGGVFGDAITFKEKRDTTGNVSRLEALMQKAKSGSYKLTLTRDPLKRSVIVKRK